MMPSVLIIGGTRPEIIKLAPVIRLARSMPDCLATSVCITGQHREMTDQALAAFEIVPDIDLDVMVPNQNLSSLTARLVAEISRLADELKPDWIIAQGDTTTVLAAAMVAFYQRIAFGHVEAGLRTGDLGNPFPEEFNRRVASLAATLHFAPTEMARQALLREAIPAAQILVTGNTIVDAARQVAELPFVWSQSPLARIPADQKYILVTAHRRESFGDGLEQICRAVLQVADETVQDGYHIVFPVHLNPNVRMTVMQRLQGVSNIHLLEPLDYRSLINLLKQCAVVLTDSGGIQEEAPAFRVPVLVMRDTTERPEGVDAGLAKLVGRTCETIVEETLDVLFNKQTWYRDSQNPYGDGQASQRIVEGILAWQGRLGGPSRP